MSKNNIRFLYICFILSVVTCQLRAQTVKYGNNETSDYGSSYKSSSYTYLMWDRNDDGSGHFDNSQTPKFFYWDNDDSKLHYLLDTGNMSQLNARFNNIDITPGSGTGKILLGRNGACDHCNVGGIFFDRKSTNDNSFTGVLAKIYGRGDPDNSNGGSLDFRISTDDGTSTPTRMLINSEGNVGIGTTTPNKRLHVNDSNGNQIQVSDGTDNGWIGFSAPDFTIWNHDIGGNIRFVFGNGSGTERVTFQDNGHVGIGTTNPTELLTVAGTAKAEEVIVTEDVGADFVFQENYDLPDLTEVEAYIKQFKHLSGIPTAGEMKREGVKVGELQIKLLQKIEELTLYTIEQQKKIMRQQNENRKLRRCLETIEEKLNLSSN